MILKWVKEKEAKQEALEERIRELEARVFYLEEREVMNRRMAYRAIKKAKPKKPEFVEGSSSGLLAVGEGKYQPINGTHKPARPEVRDPAVVDSFRH